MHSTVQAVLKSRRHWPSKIIVIDANAALEARGEDVAATAIVALADERLLSLSREFNDRIVGCYFERNGELDTIVRIVPAASEVPPEGYSLELRFASWLTCVDAPQLRTVPTFLLPWLNVKRVLILPLRIDGKRRGAMVIDASGLGRNDVVRLETVTAELAATLASISPNVSDGLLDPITASMCRIKNAPKHD